MMMRDHTADRLPEDVRQLLTHAKPEQIARLIRDIAVPQPTHEGVLTHEQ